MTSRLAVVGITVEDDSRIRRVLADKMGIGSIDDVKLFPISAKPIEVGKEVIPKKDGKLNPDGVQLVLCDSLPQKSLDIYQKLEPLTKRGLEIKKGHQTPDRLDSLTDDQIGDWIITGVAPAPEPEPEPDEDLEDLLGDLDDDQVEEAPEQVQPDPVPEVQPKPRVDPPQVSSPVIAVEPDDDPIIEVSKSTPDTKKSGFRRSRSEPVTPSLDDVLPAAEDDLDEPPIRTPMPDPVPSDQVRSFDLDRPAPVPEPRLGADEEGLDNTGSVSWEDESDDYRPIQPQGRASVPAMDIEMDSVPEPIRDEPPQPQAIPEEAVRPVPEEAPRPNIRRQVEQSPDADDHYGEAQQPPPIQQHRQPPPQTRPLPSEPDLVETPRPNRRGVDPYLDHLPDDDRLAQQEIRRSRHRHGNLGDSLSPTKKRANVILVTGSNGGVGKTTVSWMFANTMALAMHELERDTPVWLVETDYKNPKLQERLDIDDEERNLGNIASAVAKANESSTNKSRTMRRADIMRLVEENTIVMEETGLRVLVCPYNITKNAKRYIEFALMQSLDLISSEGGYVFLDSGTMTSKNYDLVDFNIAKRFVSKAIVVSDAGHFSEFMRTCWMLANQIKLQHANIGVMLNKSNTKLLPEIKKNIAPYKLIGFFPYVQEIEPSSSTGTDRAWVGDASTKVIENLKEHSGYALLHMGVREMERWFETRSPIEMSGRGIMSRILSRLAGG